MLQPIHIPYDLSRYNLRVTSASVVYHTERTVRLCGLSYNTTNFVRTEVINNTDTLQELVDNLKELVHPDVLLRYDPENAYYPWVIEIQLIEHKDKIIFICMVPEHLYPDTMQGDCIDNINITGVTFHKVESTEVEDNE